MTDGTFVRSPRIGYSQFKVTNLDSSVSMLTIQICEQPAVVVIQICEQPAVVVMGRSQTNAWK